MLAGRNPVQEAMPQDLVHGVVPSQVFGKSDEAVPVGHRCAVRSAGLEIGGGEAVQVLHPFDDLLRGELYLSRDFGLFKVWASCTKV